MDLERIRDFQRQQKELQNSIRSARPKNPETNLSPSERFSSLAIRIGNLATKEKSEGGLIFKISNWSFDNGISLHLYTFSEARWIGDPEIYNIGAEWKITEDGNETHFAREDLLKNDVDNWESLRLLGLLDESVAEAEKLKSTQELQSQSSTVK